MKRTVATVAELLATLLSGLFAGANVMEAGIAVKPVVPLLVGCSRCPSVWGERERRSRAPGNILIVHNTGTG
jgi:hypothetical protein